MCFTEERFEVGPCFLMGWIFTSKFAFFRILFCFAENHVENLDELVSGVGSIPCEYENYTVFDIIHKGFEYEGRIERRLCLAIVIFQFGWTQPTICSVHML